MEDISRELEKEIESYSSPSRLQRKSETRLIAVDDFGKMKSADWIKKLILCLLVLSVVLLLTTIIFYKLFTNYKTETLDLRGNLNSAEMRIKDLVKEKEFLMAKLVIAKTDYIEPDNKEKKDNKEKGGEKVVRNKVAKVEKKLPLSAHKKKVPVTPSTVTSATVPPATIAPKVKLKPNDNENVSIEKFIIVKDKNTGNLIINFRVLNMASEKGDASGHIFVLLSSRDDPKINKLIIPSVALKNDIPTIPARGQYFSIAHFKPVTFRVRNVANPGIYTKAIVYVFGKANALILNETINISVN